MSTPATTTNRRPATAEEAKAVLARAERAIKTSVESDIEKLLPEGYFQDFKQRRETFRQIQGGDVRELALTATVSQLRNDIEQGVFTVADAAK
jgi:hypothetical protein